MATDDDFRLRLQTGFHVILREPASPRRHLPVSFFATRWADARRRFKADIVFY